MNQNKEHAISYLVQTLFPHLEKDKQTDLYNMQTNRHLPTNGEAFLSLSPSLNVCVFKAYLGCCC